MANSRVQLAMGLTTRQAIQAAVVLRA